MIGETASYHFLTTSLDLLLPVKMDLLHLPELVLIKVFQYVGIQDTVLNVSKVCWDLNNFVHTHSAVWKHINLEERTCPVTFSTEQKIRSLLKNAQCFHCFDVPGIIMMYPLDKFFNQCLNDNLVRSVNLSWLDLCGSPVSDLSFLAGCPNLETLILAECVEIDDENFKHLSILHKLFYLDAGFTRLTGETLSVSVHQPIVYIEVCCIILNLSVK